ncbi:DNA-binding response regulator [Paenibacillus sp. 598K]|uniref:response regulator n=1 Tax=Paenibacillus sp. 598K TaxID=1117987 RepID=UPI000FF9463F|nr:response regulator [Paenibacillus sp. 598K]GBF74739.1 DNA-binding response regulator [Paenibacillus sp. 598K]
MYRVLIVDDQYFALLGLQQGVNWQELEVDDVQLADNVEQAIACFGQQPIDLLICDIEMPGQTGLELLSWVEAHSPATRTIMLTCHADFEYAQRAIHHGAFHYLLKPVDYGQLKKVAGDAFDEVRRLKEQQTYKGLLEDYQHKWNQQLPVLVERFWQDVLSRRESLQPGSLDRALAACGLSFEPEDRFVVVLFGLESWAMALSARDETIMEYALRNIAGEVVLDGLEGVVLLDHAGLNLAIVYERGDRPPIAGLLEHNSGRFLEQCERLLQCSLSVYISPAVPLPGIVGAYAQVTGQEQRNISRNRQVFTASSPLDRLREPTPASAPWSLFTEWATILELGEQEELHRRVRQWFDSQAVGWTKESMEQFVSGVLFIVYTLLAKKGLRLNDSPALKSLTDKESYPKQLSALDSWTLHCLEAAGELLRASNNVSSTAVSKIRAYIRAHLDEEITREELAAHVYLNPAYLSRMFKKETGLSLWDAIIQERLQEAKRLLEETEYKITEIAERVGYTSLGSFSNLFKRVVGVTPQQYRAKRRRESGAGVSDR